MKGTAIFRFKGWPKIHQPLPRTPRESQQLLNALTSSFRRQLDRAYPASDSPPDHQGDDQQPSVPDSSAHATDQHLHNILDNPLFRIVPSKASVAPESKRSLLANDRKDAHEEQRRLATEPMVVFEELAASGTVTPADIANCLKSQLLLFRSPAGSDVREAMKASQAASKVVAWFWASDGPSRQMLLHSRACTASLTKFMVAQDLQGTVMTWLRMLMQKDLGGCGGQIAEPFARQTFRCLLIDLVDAEMRYGRGLGSAMSHYLQACQMLFSSLDPQLQPLRKPMLLGGGAHLSRAVMDNSASTEKVPISIYEEFIQAIASLSPESLLASSVALYHPTNPDLIPFLRFVESLSPKNLQSWNDARRDAFLRIGIEALRILMDRQKHRDASHLAQQIQQLLPDKTSPQTTVKAHYYTSPEKEYKSLLHRLHLSLA